jgi:histidinol-phosphate/aromatic aminotransferase/cobyric acid decarboxylase-like protein
MSAVSLAAKLKKKGLLVRTCGSFGTWGRAMIRLNPLTEKANQQLAQAIP